MRPLLYITLTALVILLVTLALGHREMLQVLATDDLFEIPGGSSLNQVASELSAAGLLPADPFLFQAYARATRFRGPIQAGEYRLASGMDSYALLALLRSGKVQQYDITFPEGWRLSEWQTALDPALDPALDRSAGLRRESVLAAALAIEGAPEGWFFPDTYRFVKGDSNLAILRRAHLKMQQVLEGEWARREPTQNLATPYDALILASVIEKETGHGPDRATIASVFHNRLARGMRLESDPTVIYGLSADYDGNLTRAHLATDGPFNTYTRHGLPPTPICSPGLASIRAALSPATSDYLYFVAKGNGESYFSSTLAEHNQAVRRYQRGATSQ